MKPSEVLFAIVSRLEKLAIPYMVGGSFASSYYGRVRSTYSADLVVGLQQQQVDPFIKSVRRDFYVDRGQVVQGLRMERSFNLIHFKSSFKVDLFPLKNTPFESEEFSRRMKRRIIPDSPTEVYVQTPEGTLLSKLQWYRMGQEVSDT